MIGSGFFVHPEPVEGRSHVTPSHPSLFILAGAAPPLMVSSDRRSSADFIEHPRQRREVSIKSDLSKDSSTKVWFDKLTMIGSGFSVRPERVEGPFRERIVRQAHHERVLKDAGLAEPGWL